MAKIDPPPSNINEFNWSWREWIHRLFSDGVLDHDSRLDADEANIASNTSRITALENNGDSAWTPLPLFAGFTPVSGFATIGVRKLSSGLVVLKGVINVVTANAGSSITRMPVGYRPLESQKYYFRTNQQGTVPYFVGTLTLYASTGLITFDQTPPQGQNRIITLHNIVFYGEQ